MLKSLSKNSLAAVFDRMNLTIALLATALVASFVTTLGVSTLRIYAEDNLLLIARSTSYAVEAAVFFRDSEATREGLAVIMQTERVAIATITDIDGKLLAQWEQPANHMLDDFKRYLATFLQGSVEQPIESQGRVIGYLSLQADGEKLFSFILRGLLGTLGCLLIVVAGTLYLSRRVQRRVSLPLDALGLVARSALRDRDFSVRLPPSSIQELDELGQNFNGLLDEMQAWHASIQSENLQLSQKASHDGLTGLLNRSAFEACLQQTCIDATQQGYRFAVFFIDSDGFKHINDHHGHAAGDQVLQIIARRIRAQVRESDVSSRLGGDEFAVLISPLNETGDSIVVAEKIIAAMQQPVLLEGGDVLHTSLSIGIAIFPEHGCTAAELLMHADTAMYEVKKNGKEGWQLAGSHQSDLQTGSNT